MANDYIQELGELLAEAGAHVRLRRERIGQSTLYDANYHVSVIACAFCLHGKKDNSGMLVVDAAHLKLLQFVAARPVLLPDLLSWLKERRHRTLDMISKMPRGYVGDRTHDRTVTYLLATGVLQALGKKLKAGPRHEFLVSIFSDVVSRNLLRIEREVLEELQEVNVSRVALEGR